MHYFDVLLGQGVMEMRRVFLTIKLVEDDPFVCTFIVNFIYEVFHIQHVLNNLIARNFSDRFYEWKKKSYRENRCKSFHIKRLRIESEYELSNKLNKTSAGTSRGRNRAQTNRIVLSIKWKRRYINPICDGSNREHVGCVLCVVCDVKCSFYV